MLFGRVIVQVQASPFGAFRSPIVLFAQQLADQSNLLQNFDASLVHNQLVRLEIVVQELVLKTVQLVQAEVVGDGFDQIERFLLADALGVIGSFRLLFDRHKTRQDGLLGVKLELVPDLNANHLLKAQSMFDPLFDVLTDF